MVQFSTKMITSGLLKIKGFQNKDFDVIVSFHDFIDKILSRESNYIVDVALWRKFGNSTFQWEK